MLIILRRKVKLTDHVSFITFLKARFQKTKEEEDLELHSPIV